MKDTRRVCLFVLLAVAAASCADKAKPEDAMPMPAQSAMTCVTNGALLNYTQRICYYNCGGEQVAMAVTANKFCPLTIKRQTETP